MKGLRIISVAGPTSALTNTHKVYIVIIRQCTQCDCIVYCVVQVSRGLYHVGNAGVFAAAFKSYSDRLNLHVMQMYIVKVHTFGG